MGFSKVYKAGNKVNSQGLNIVFVLACIFFILFSEQKVLMIFSIGSLILSFKLFWKPYEPKVIFLGVLLSWLSITIKIFYADLAGVSYVSLSISPNIINTTYLSIIGFCIFCFGIHTATRNLVLTNKGMNDLFNKPLNFNRLLIVYGVAAVTGTILKAFVFAVPGLSQLLNGFLQMKLGFLFLLLFYSFKNRSHILLIMAIVIIEVVLSFFSYFANFKDIIFTGLVIVLLFPYRLRPLESIAAIFLGVGFLYIVLIWQSVKGDYRQFISGGQKAQVVVVSQDDALRKLQELSTEKSSNNLPKDVVYSTVDRIGYIEFFSQATDNVPAKIDYEYGRLWKENILHVLQPRLFFPNKPAIDDSKMVNMYATKKVATASQGTTFSLGYMAESYIDFGPVLMFVPIFFVGWLLGYIYRIIIEQSLNYFWGFTFVSTLWINVNCNGTPGSKILGWILMYYIAFILFRYWLMKPLDNYIMGGDLSKYWQIK